MKCLIAHIQRTEEMMRINKKISKYNHTVYYKRQIDYIVIHWVGAVSKAKNNAIYFAGGDRQASAHYFVDDTSIWQSVLDKNASWHCGGGLQGKGGHSYYGKCKNANSIGIEICCIKKDGKLIVDPKAIEKASVLVQALMKEHNIPANRVIRHFDVTGKLCPGGYTTSKEWSKLHAALTGINQTVTSVKTTTKLSAPSRTLKFGDRGSEVEKLQRCLNKTIKTFLNVDGSFGPATEKAVKKFQKKYKLEVDGICGPKTRAKIKDLI